MSDLIWLSEAQMRRIEPYFPLLHGVSWADDRRIISGIIFIIRDGLRWRDAPADYSPPKTIYNRCVRWIRMGVFNKIFADLAPHAGKLGQLMVDGTHLKAHRTATSLLRRCGSTMYRRHQGWVELEAARRLRWPGQTADHAAQRRSDERLQRGGPDDPCVPEGQGSARGPGL